MTPEPEVFTKEQAMNAVAKRDEHVLAASVPEAGAMDRLIEKALADPGFDVEKLERLFALAERTRASQAEQVFNEALNEAQGDLGPVAADASNPQTKSKYASYPALDRAIRPIYARHGFSLSFGTAEGAPADYIRVTCQVAHRAGHSRLYHVDMPADGKGAKGGDVMTKTHAVGAALSYAQRYLLKLVFNIAVGDDSDGNAPTTMISDLQVSDLAALMDEVGADRDRFLNFLRVDTLAHLPARRFEFARKALEAKRAQ